MESLPILDGLTNEEFENLLGICTKVDLPKNADVYRVGQPSVDMYILTEGALLVSLWGKEISRIFPVSPVGEMGLFTGETRSADVATLTNCSLLRITKSDLFDLFSRDKDLHIRFQQGMINDLSHKLRMNNEVIAKLRSKADKGR